VTSSSQSDTLAAVSSADVYDGGAELNMSYELAVHDLRADLGLQIAEARHILVSSVVGPRLGRHRAPFNGQLNSQNFIARLAVLQRSNSRLDVNQSLMSSTTK
jgi:hypothetical protein